MKTNKINNTITLALGFLLITLLCRAQETPPNILLIIADQHTGKIMSQRGYPHLNTPGIDKIAYEGVTFTRAYTPYPVCMSFRRSMMTGLMPSKASNLTSHPSIGKTLRDAGYETAYHGKWHVGNTNIDDVAEWHGFETYDRSQKDTGTRKRVIDFLKQTHDKPFFLVTSFLNPHDACGLAGAVAGRSSHFNDGAVEVHMDLQSCPPLPANFAIPENEAEGFYGRRNQEPGDNYWTRHPTTHWTHTEWRQYMYGYDRLVEKVDAHIKIIVDELENLGLLENTVIIYTSDHGDGHASHQWNQKMTFYEESINIPFIISWKGKTKAGMIDEETLVNNGLDLYPTLLKLAGLTLPASLHGMNLLPAVLQDPGGEELAARNYVVSEINQRIYTGDTPGKFIGRMLVSADFKYILFDKGENREQLFDLLNDPGELKPVTYDPAYRDQLISSRNMLKEWTKKISDNDFNVELIQQGGKNE